MASTNAQYAQKDLVKDSLASAKMAVKLMRSDLDPDFDVIGCFRHEIIDFKAQLVRQENDPTTNINIIERTEEAIMGSEYIVSRTLAVFVGSGDLISEANERTEQLREVMAKLVEKKLKEGNTPEIQVMEQELRGLSSGLIGILEGQQKRMTELGTFSVE